MHSITGIEIDPIEEEDSVLKPMCALQKNTEPDVLTFTVFGIEAKGM